MPPSRFLMVFYLTCEQRKEQLNLELTLFQNVETEDKNYWFYIILWVVNWWTLKLGTAPAIWGESSFCPIWKAKARILLYFPASISEVSWRLLEIGTSALSAPRTDVIHRQIDATETKSFWEGQWITQIYISSQWIMFLLWQQEAWPPLFVLYWRSSMTVIGTSQLGTSLNGWYSYSSINFTYNREME